MNRALAFGLAGLLCAACGPPDGTRRPLNATWANTGDPPAPRCLGEEVRHAGGWVKDGPVVFYDRAGRETHRGQYVLGQESGLWEERDHRDGSLAKGAYEAGQRTGEWAYFHASGTLAERGRYVDGERQGQWEGFHPNGTRAADEMWEAGKRHGRLTFWDSEGRLRTTASGMYVDDERVGD